MTTKQLAVEYRAMQARSSPRNGLWHGAYGLVAAICEKYHRGRAKAMLRRMAHSCRKMSVSSVYAGAAASLKSPKRRRK